MLASPPGPPAQYPVMSGLPSGKRFTGPAGGAGAPPRPRPAPPCCTGGCCPPWPAAGNEANETGFSVGGPAEGGVPITAWPLGPTPSRARPAAITTIELSNLFLIGI